jgi:hypothetical protein
MRKAVAIIMVVVLLSFGLALARWHRHMAVSGLFFG